MQGDFDVVWQDRFREPTEEPDPRYPFGLDAVDPELEGQPLRARCSTPLPYPAPRCGTYLVTCRRCGFRVGVTTAGRPDDPRSLTIACPQTNAVKAYKG